MDGRMITICAEGMKTPCWMGLWLPRRSRRAWLAEHWVSESGAAEKKAATELEIQKHPQAPLGDQVLDWIAGVTTELNNEGGENLFADRSPELREALRVLANILIS